MYGFSLLGGLWHRWSLLRRWAALLRCWPTSQVVLQKWLGGFERLFPLVLLRNFMMDSSERTNVVRQSSAQAPTSDHKIHLYEDECEQCSLVYSREASSYSLNSNLLDAHHDCEFCREQVSAARRSMLYDLCFCSLSVVELVDGLFACLAFLLAFLYSLAYIHHF